MKDALIRCKSFHKSNQHHTHVVNTGCAPRELSTQSDVADQVKRCLECEGRIRKLRGQRNPAPDHVIQMALRHIKTSKEKCEAILVMTQDEAANHLD